MELMTAVKAFGTVSTSIGGYTNPPKIWQRLASHDSIQIGALTVLVWQSGHTSLLIALCIALIFYMTTLIVKHYDDELVALYERVVGKNDEAFDGKYFNPRFTE